MSAAKHFAFVVAYGVFAVAAAVLVPFQVQSLGAEVGVGIAVFVLAATLHHFIARGERDQVVERHLDALYTSRDKLVQDFQSLREENRALLTGLSEVADHAFERQITKAQNELRMMRSLKGQIAAEPATAVLLAGGSQEPASPALASPIPAPTPSSRAPVTSAPASPDSGQKPQARTDLSRSQMLNVLCDALKNERIDLFLQPVVRLPQRTPRYYECFSRIRAADGSIVAPGQYIEIAKEHGLLRAIDNMLLFRCIQLVRKAQRRNHDLGFLCNISMQTLGDREFFPQFIAFMEENRNLASRLVFELAEEDIAAQWETFADGLAKLARLGFRFSMDHVKHLSFDPDLMASRQFAFVKVEAGTLLKYAGDGGKNLQKFREELRRNRIELVVEKVETERQLLELLDLDISFAQGYLFGQPRLSRAE